jgi:hypothetical protein
MARFKGRVHNMKEFDEFFHQRLSRDVTLLYSYVDIVNDCVEICIVGAVLFDDGDYHLVMNTVFQDIYDEDEEERMLEDPFNNCDVEGREIRSFNDIEDSDISYMDDLYLSDDLVEVYDVFRYIKKIHQEVSCTYDWPFTSEERMTV